MEKESLGGGSASQVSMREIKKRGAGFAELKTEFKRVEWTSKDELITYTKVVLASIFLFGMLVYLVDLSIQSLLSGIAGLLRMIVN